MSVEAVSEVLGPTHSGAYRRIDDPRHLAVLVVLAEAASDDGVTWIGVETIAARARTAKRTCERRLAELGAAGEIEIRKAHDPRRPRVSFNVYRVLSGRLAEAEVDYGRLDENNVRVVTRFSTANELARKQSDDPPTVADGGSSDDPPTVADGGLVDDPPFQTPRSATVGGSGTVREPPELPNGRPLLRDVAREGLPIEHEHAVDKLMRVIASSADEGTRAVLASFARRLPLASLARITELTSLRPLAVGPKQVGSADRGLVAEG